MTKTDRASVERLVRLLDDDADQQYYLPCEMTGLLPDDEYEIANRLRGQQARIGMLEADFDDCNSERARWKARAEQAEAKLAILDDDQSLTVAYLAGVVDAKADLEGNLKTKLADVWDEAVEAAAQEAADTYMEYHIANAIRTITNPYRSE